MEIRKRLIEAEEKAVRFFSVIEKRGLMVPGKSEHDLNIEIFALAKELFGIEKFWHKRIVRAGKNTLEPYRVNPPDLILQADDILFLDFGPVFEEWEADLGRTYVIGHDPLKIKLRDDIEKAWHEAHQWYGTKTKISGAELYQYVADLALKYGWTFGNEHAGHLIGKFPHENIKSEIFDNYIRPENITDLFAPDPNGKKREWILEIHFVDREKEIGGFYEQLLR